VVLTAQVPSDATLFRRALASLGVRPGLRLETRWPGVFATTTSTDDGQHALHLINTSGAPAELTVGLEGTAVADGVSLRLPARSGHVLPLGLEIAGRRFDWVSAEFAGLDATGEPVFGFGLDPDGGTTIVVDGRASRVEPGKRHPATTH
jgi:beta-galactosidase